MRILTLIIQNGYFQFAMGVVLLLSIVIDDFFISLNHSLMAVGAYHILVSLPDVLQGLERVSKWRK